MNYKLSLVMAAGLTAMLAASVRADVVPTLGTATDFTLLSVPGNTKWNLSKAYIDGNVGVGDSGSVAQSKNSTISNGYVYVTQGAGQYTYSAQGTHVNAYVDAAKVNQAIADVQAADSAIRALTATYTIAGGLNSAGATTITGNGGLNVIDITGNLTLDAAKGSGGGLFFSGSSSDYFIVRISGNVALSGGSFLGGINGVDASHIIYDLVGASGTLNTDKDNAVSGSMIFLNYTATLDGAFNNLYGGNGSTVTLQSGVTVTGVPFTPPTGSPPPVPEAATVSILGVSAVGLLMRRKKA